MLLYISFIGFFVALLLGFYNRNRFAGNYFLVSFFAINALYGIVFYSFRDCPSVVFSAIMHGHFMPVLYLGGPMAFFYVRSLITDDSRLTRKDWVHFIPFLILFVGIIPYYFKDFSYKVALCESIRNDPKVFLTNINVLVPQRLNIISRPLIMIAYFLMSIRMWIRHKEVVRRKTLLKGIYFKHLYLFVVLLLVLPSLLAFGMLVSTVMMVYSFDANLSLNLPILFVDVVGFCYFALNSFVFVFPEILYGLPRYRHLPHLHEAVSDLQPAVVSAAQNAVGNSTLRPPFSADYLVKMEEQILDYIQDKPFLDFEFNLTRMSSETEIPIHHLSYYFNNILQLSFSDWRNKLRVEHAVGLITNGFAKDHSLNAVSQESGFSSQVTFIRAFRNHTGLTPGEHLKLVK